jgi:D-alanine-D-alanine ligase
MSTLRFTSEHRVGVLMGGLSSERNISLKSGKAVAESLRSRGYHVIEIVVNRDIATVLEQEQIDVAWLALHGTYGEDGCIQGLLEIMQIPYTSSGVLACSVSMHKTSTKRALRDTGVNLCQDAVWSADQPFPSEWSAPVVIKDPLGGSSIGVWVCYTDNDLRNAIAECQQLGGEFLIEEYVSGIEITVALLDGEALPVITIIPHNEYFDLEAKYTKGQTTYLAPQSPEDVIAPESMVPRDLALSAQQQAAEAYTILGMRGICRADFIVPCTGKHPNVSVDPNAIPVFLEMNAIPGMTATSLTPMAANVVGLSFADLTEQVLQTATTERT